LVLLLMFLGGGIRHATAYSLLTHEQLIDLTWDDSIVPLLLSRYPNLTRAELERARAYAYGGCVIQDIGYYPFGQMFLSNLTHYVRSGDFVVNLFRNARDANELAFAVGALSHYIGDTYGHSLATNLAVPVEFPKLGIRYGKVVSFGEGENEHVQTEFAFDINELAHHRMAPVHYLRHVGLAVSTRQLSLAFYQTYGLYEKFTGIRRMHVNVGDYRFAVRAFIPRIAYAIALLHRKEEPADPTTAEVVALHKEIGAIAVENQWDKYRHGPGIGTYMLAGLLFVLPKVGPLKLVAVKGPTEATDAEYDHSVAESTSALRRDLARFTPPAYRHARPHASPPDNGRQPRPDPPNSAARTDVPRESRDPHHPLPNRDLDTGHVVRPGGYPLTDATFAHLLHVLTQQPAQPVPPGVKRAILAFYADPELPITTKKHPRKWKQVLADLQTLKTMRTSPEPEEFPTYDELQPAEQ
jgi:hypothetical protein